MSATRSLAVAVLLGWFAAQAAAQYPTKPIRVIVSFPPGGQVETATRIVADALSQSLGQPVIVETKPGADGQIAALEARKAAPDGYTLFVGSSTSLSMVPVVRQPPPYDPLADFTPISYMGEAAFFVLVHAGVPATSLEQLITHARANPGKLAYGSASAFVIAATAHLMHHTGIQMLHVPYKGEAPALPDLIAQRIQVMIATPALALPYIKEGRLRALAALPPQRSVLLPDVPTIVELGYPPVPMQSWLAFFGPANLRPEVTDRLGREINAILARSSVREDMERRALMVRGSSPEELRLLVREQQEAWRRAVRDGWVQQQ